MTPAELVAFAVARHGEHWYGPLAEETGYSFSHLWRVANEGRPVGRKLELAVKNLKRIKKVDLSVPTLHPARSL